jgi:sugar phosphate permease
LSTSPEPVRPFGLPSAEFRKYQIRNFALTWLSYASYYFTRKNVAVVKSTLNEDLGVSITMLGGIDTLYLAIYALGQFVNGGLGDKFGAKRMISVGMIGTALLSFIFGLSSHAWIFGLCFGLNGVFQSTGWPNNVKAMQPWIPRKRRGFLMGIWCTNYQVGGLVATALATFLLVNWGWRSAFFVPGVWVSIVGGLVLLFLVERPKDRGLPPIDPEESAETAPSPDGKPERSGFMEVIRMPVLWILGGAYFGLKLIRYSLLFWLPFFLHNGLDYDIGTAGYLSTSFEAGGIVGVFLIGRIADRFFSQNAMKFVVPVVFSLAGAFLLLQVVSPMGIWPVGLSLALIGFLLFGPDALISGAMAQNVGGDKSTASAAGFINGVGSIGGASSGLVTAYVSQAWGWNTLFTVFVGFAIISGFTLLPLAWKKKI